MEAARTHNVAALGRARRANMRAHSLVHTRHTCPPHGTAACMHTLPPIDDDGDGGNSADARALALLAFDAASASADVARGLGAPEQLLVGIEPERRGVIA